MRKYMYFRNYPFSMMILFCLIGVAAFFTLSCDHNHPAHSHDHTEASAMHSDVPYTPLTPELLERFHGHLGPYVAFGGLIGEHAINHFHVPRYFDLMLNVYCPAAPPSSCLIDGLQTSLGATFGKKNIKHIISGSIRVEIEDKVNKKHYIYTIKPEAMTLLKDWETQGMDVEERGHKLFAMQPEEVLSWEEE